MITFAGAQDIKPIRELWIKCFGDTQPFDNWFFDNVFDTSCCLLYKLDGKLAAMLTMLPYTLEGIGDVTYIYGAGTGPDYRCRGLMTELLQKSFKIDIGNGKCGSMLIPANKSLFDFYARLGYKTAAYIKQGNNESLGLMPKDKLRQATVDDIPLLNRLYTENKPQNIHLVLRSSKKWAEIISLSEMLGGGVYICEDNTGYAVLYDNQIQEGVGRIDELCTLLGTEKYITFGEENPFGMLKLYNGYSAPKLYINLLYN